MADGNDKTLEQRQEPLRKDIESVFNSIANVVKASLRPLPTETGDGTYIEDETHSSLLKDLSTIDSRDALTVAEMLKEKVTREPTDDKKYHMERVITVCSRSLRCIPSANVSLSKLASDLPSNSKRAEGLTNGLINVLWSDLQHPPLS